MSSELIPLIGIIAVVILLFAVAGFIIFRVKKKQEAARENLFPSGADETEWTRQLQKKYHDEGR